MLPRAKDYVRATLATHEKTRRLAELATDALCGATHAVVDAYGEWIPLGWLARDAATVFRREAFDVLQAPYASLQASVHTLEGLIAHLRSQLATIEEELFAARARAEVLAQQLRDEEDHTSRLERERALALARGRALQSELEAHKDQVQRTLEDLDRTETLTRALDSELEVRALEAQRDDMRRALEALQNAHGLRTPPVSEREIPALDYGHPDEEEELLPIPGGLPSGSRDHSPRSPSAHTFGIHTPAQLQPPPAQPEPLFEDMAPIDPPPLELRGEDADQFLQALGITGDALQAFEDERALEEPDSEIPMPQLVPALASRVSFGSFASLGARAQELDGDATVVEDSAPRRLSVVVGPRTLLGGEETQSPDKFGGLGESGPPSGDDEQGRLLFDARTPQHTMEQALRALLEMQPGGSAYAADDSSDEGLPAEHDGSEAVLDFWLPSFAAEAQLDPEEPPSRKGEADETSSRTTDVSLEHEDDDEKEKEAKVELRVVDFDLPPKEARSSADSESVGGPDLSSSSRAPNPDDVDDGAELTVDGADDKLSMLPVPPTPHTIETTTSVYPEPGEPLDSESEHVPAPLARSRLLDVEGFVIESAPPTVRFPAPTHANGHSHERHKGRLAQMLEAGIHALERGFSGHRHRRTRSESGSASGSSSSDSTPTPRASPVRNPSMHKLVKPRSRTNSARNALETGALAHAPPHGRHVSDSDAHLRSPRLSLAGRFSSLREGGSKK